MPDRNADPQLDPVFSRRDVARILNVSPLTIRNRELAKKYPAPRRDLNNYRIYTLNEVFTLQQLTVGRLDTRPIISVLYDKGYRNLRDLGVLLDGALARRNGSPS